ncbi:MAG: hypothetical protein WCP77_21570 [Roseococcus sp.]
MKRIYLAAALGVVVGSAGSAIAAYQIPNTNSPLGVTTGKTARIVCVDNNGNPRSNVVPTSQGAQPVNEGNGVTNYWFAVRCP